MTTPGQPLQIIHPNGTTILYLNPYSGTYTASRSYGLRMQRGYARGLPQYEARGKPASEARIRRERTQAQFGQTPWQRYTRNFERRYGFSYQTWRRLRVAYIDQINSLTSKDGFGHITPYSIASMIQLFQGGWRDPMYPEYDNWETWVEARLDARLSDTLAYQEERDPLPGRRSWLTKSSNPPVEFYYYH